MHRDGDRGAAQAYLPIAPLYLPNISLHLLYISPSLPHISLSLRRAAAWKPAEMELKWDWGTKTFDVFLSHKITDAKDIVLGWYNTLSAMTYKPFLDRLSLDKVENIPRYITETATVLIAVTTNLFESYWCAVELCKAVECHAQGTLNIILCPIQNDMWAVPGGDGAKLTFPTPAMVMANFGKWFPELKDSTRELIELLYGGGPYTESRTVYHTLRWPGLGIGF